MSLSATISAAVDAAFDAIGDLKQTVIVRKTTTGAYDPASGTLTSPSDADTNVEAVVDTYEQRFVDGERIHGDDLRIFMKTDATPEQGDHVIIEGVPHKIISVSVIRPGQTSFLYEVQARL